MGQDLWAVYLATEVRIELSSGEVVAVRAIDGPVVDAWPLDAREAWIITACNPRSVQLADAENEARHLALGDALRTAGYQALPATGCATDGSEWREPGYAVLDAPFHVIDDLARRWEQNAVFHWSPDRWVLVGVLMEGETSCGWRLA